MNIIFLIGMPFAGKTYWAKKLSDHYDVPYIDMDAAIEAQTGKTIAQIFETEGQPFFRKLEQQLLHTIIDNYPRPLIVSCGGGTSIFSDNLSIMKQAGCVVYLTAAIETLVSRFEGVEENNERPLLASVPDIEEELVDLLESRKNIYEQAHYIIACEGLSVVNFEQIFSRCTDRHL